MAEQYQGRPYGSQHTATRKRRRKRRRRHTVKRLSLLAVGIIVVASAIVIAVRVGKKTNELVGTWIYDEHTQYVFEKDSTGKLLADDVTYTYVYFIKGEKLTIDFTEDIIRDCDYTFSVNNAVLTLVGGDGTDGGTYKLNKK